MQSVRNIISDDEQYHYNNITPDIKIEINMIVMPVNISLHGKGGKGFFDLAIFVFHTSIF